MPRTPQRPAAKRHFPRGDGAAASARSTGAGEVAPPSSDDRARGVKGCSPGPGVRRRVETGYAREVTRVRATLGSLVFLVLAPGTAAGLVPYWISRWRTGPAPLGLEPLRWAGAALVLAGLPVLLDSFARFALQGLGTPAPVAPTRHLVVSGPYRHVRNPMYVAVVSLVLGQGLLLGSRAVLGYALALWLVFHLFVLGYEEPTLRRTFGAEYEAFRANVPRWIPRLTAWAAGRR